MFFLSHLISSNYMLFLFIFPVCFFSLRINPNVTCSCSLCPINPNYNSSFTSLSLAVCYSSDLCPLLLLFIPPFMFSLSSLPAHAPVCCLLTHSLPSFTSITSSHCLSSYLLFHPLSLISIYLSATPSNLLCVCIHLHTPHNPISFFPNLFCSMCTHSLMTSQYITPSKAKLTYEPLFRCVMQCKYPSIFLFDPHLIPFSLPFHPLYAIFPIHFSHRYDARSLVSVLWGIVSNS